MGRPREFDEQAVITACRDTFWEHGYEATSIQHLTRATKLKTQSLYTAFGNKRELFLRALAAYCEAQTAGLARSVAEAPSAWSAVLAITTYDDSGRLPLPPWGCMLARSMIELGHHDAQVRSLGERTFTATMATLTDCIRAAISDGEIAPLVEAAELANAAYTMSQGIATLRATTENPDSYRESKRAASAALNALARPR
jgi:AcrR family transcriptional regulator